MCVRRFSQDAMSRLSKGRKRMMAKNGQKTGSLNECQARINSE